MRIKAAASLASQVAHECRTPLTGIRFEAEGCERLLAKLPHSQEREKLLSSHLRVRQHITSANSVIDLLLCNVAQHHRGAPEAGDRPLAVRADARPPPPRRGPERTRGLRLALPLCRTRGAVVGRHRPHMKPHALLPVGRTHR